MASGRYDARVTSPDLAAQRLVAAIGSRDQTAYRIALDHFAETAWSASLVDIEAALARLATVLPEVPLGPYTDLAHLVGGLAGRLPAPAPVLDVLVERAAQALENAAQFVALHAPILGDPPPPDDATAILETLGRFGAAVSAQGVDPYPLVEAWFAGSEWLQPMLYLAQRHDVRASLPQRERLFAAAESLRERLPAAESLYGLLLVLDDAPLIVLDRSTGKGYRVIISGIGDNLQLNILLAARLIGDPRGGWLEGQRPPDEMIAAADGTGMAEPPGGVVASFRLVDAYGQPIPDDGRPAGIPQLHGERIVILHPPQNPPTWRAGRLYPVMGPELRVERRLRPDQAWGWLAEVGRSTTSRSQ